MTNTLNTQTVVTKTKKYIFLIAGMFLIVWNKLQQQQTEDCLFITVALFIPVLISTYVSSTLSWAHTSAIWEVCLTQWVSRFLLTVSCYWDRNVCRGFTLTQWAFKQLQWTGAGAKMGTQYLPAQWYSHCINETSYVSLITCYWYYSCDSLAAKWKLGAGIKSHNWTISYSSW